MGKLFAGFALCLLFSFYAISATGVDRFKGSPAIQGCSYSILAVNLSSGDTLLSENANQRLVPASLLKLFTTGASLELLGVDYRFKTQFGYRGDIINGVLQGDLVIQGFGDPTLGSSYFSSTHPDSVFLQLTRRIKVEGIKSITGRILIIDNYFDSKEQPSGRLFEDVSNYYGATPNSLNWRDNSFTLYLNSSSITNVRCEIVRTEPKVENISFYSNVFSSKLNQDSAYLYPLRDGLVVRGSIPVNKSGFPIKGVLSSPALQFASELRSYLSLNEVDIDSLNVPEITNITIGFNPLLTIYSPSVNDIITITNHKSINLFADALFLTMGKQNSSNWHWSGGAQELTSFWNQRISSCLSIEDGSGMSPRNLITSNDVVALLKYEYLSKNYIHFKNSLATAGVRGTLKGAFLNQKDRFFGKSGSMKGVLCYGGYYVNQKGETIAISVMVNNFIGKTTVVKSEIERLFNAVLK